MKKYFLLLSLASLLSFNGFSQHAKSLHSDSLDVLHYRIELDLTEMASNQISAKTSLQLVPKVNNLNNVSLDLLKLIVDSIKIDGAIVPSFSYNDTLLNFATTETFDIIDSFLVDVYYHGDPVIDPSGWGGFYTNSNYAFNLGVAFADNPHNYGRAWYPCVDDFIDRASYEYIVTVLNPRIVVCGGYQENVVDNGDGSSTYFWRMDEEIPTYLSSVAAGLYVHVKDTFNGLNGEIPIDIYAYPGDSLDAVNSFINLKEIAAAYENYYGPYRWNRIGFTATSQGAMEHPTNISYPYFCIDGTLTNEWLYAHELSHHWFGDLVTCNSAEDMWINEGWAVFSEFTFTEALYGKDEAKNYVRDQHKTNLQFLHHTEGYYAITGIPHDITYGNTVYDKGATVTHSLRGYLGDELFFNTVKAYMDAYAFSDISSAQLRDFFSSYTGIDMTDFFDAWVFQPGYVHFSIDSFRILAGESPFQIEVFARQRTRGPAALANSNRVEITFMDNYWNQYSEIMTFDGETGSQIFEVPFLPTLAMMDIDEKLCDATTDSYVVAKEVANYDFVGAHCRIDVSELSDSAFIRVEHNWVTPDPLNPDIPGIILSNQRYWRVDAILPDTFNATGRFYYNKLTSTNNGYLDWELVTNSIDSLVLLYRENPAHNWDTIGFTRVGNSFYGNLVCDSLIPGEYVLGIYDWNQWLTINTAKTPNNLFNVYPNPSSGVFNIDLNEKTSGKISIYSITGVLIDEFTVNEESKIEWNPVNHPSGTYVISFNGKKGKGVKKVVYGRN
ncbi:MAG: T9SS type A sorting domain-containing protein [Bacteroidales bacterium]|nr:T9SS type A sorting domain-containing protein [Bacteroidales bacterium]